MSAHCFFPPSGAKAWRKCAAWSSMNQRYPQEDTEASKEGTAAHWVAWGVHAGQDMHEGMEAPNGMIVTAEMVGGAEMLIAEINKLSNPKIEQTVIISRVHANCFGTPDVWDFDPITKRLTVLDYKFGHRFVDEYENEQIISYVAGILELVEKDGVTEMDVTVNAIIVQPRCFYKGKPIRTWTFKASAIRGIVNNLNKAAQDALDADPLAVTNSECGDCPGRHACSVFQMAI